MAMGEGRGTILTLPVFGFFGSRLAPVDLEFVDGISVLGGAEVGFQPVGSKALGHRGQAAVDEPDRMIHRCTSRVRQPGALATQPHGIAIFTLFQAFF
jgi:hypothetical protein